MTDSPKQNFRYPGALPRFGVIVVSLLFGLAAAGCGKGKVFDIPRGTETVTIFTEPQGAIIAFDGSVRGRTYEQQPLVIKGVSHGWHTIKATLPGRVPRVEEVRIDGSETKIRIPISQDTFGRISIIVDPPGAEVFIDSRYYGMAEPGKNIDSLAFGEHTLWLRLKGFRSEKRTITVERQFHRAYRLRMQVDQ
jgi:hypothetical protein